MVVIVSLSKSGVVDAKLTFLLYSCDVYFILLPPKCLGMNLVRHEHVCETKNPFSWKTTAIKCSHLKKTTEKKVN
jgi:hypothetical protein